MIGAANPRDLLVALATRLVATCPTVRIYDGQVGKLTTGATEPVVLPYAVLYASPGWATSPTVCGDQDELAWSVQVTVAANYQGDLLAAIHRVRLALAGHRLVLTAGGAAGQLMEVGGRPPMLRDDDMSPPRYYVPLAYETTITTT